LVIIIIVLSAVLTIFKIGRPWIFLKDAKGGAAAPPLNPPLTIANDLENHDPRQVVYTKFGSQISDKNFDSST